MYELEAHRTATGHGLVVTLGADFFQASTMTSPPEVSIDSDGVEKSPPELSTSQTETSSDPVRGVILPPKRSAVMRLFGEICLPTAGAVLLLALLVGMGVYLNPDEPGTVTITP